MDLFPRTTVGGVSLPRLIVGSNWFLGYSHTSLAKDKFIKDFQTRDKIAGILSVFLENGVDAVMGPVNPLLENAIQEAEQKSGQSIIRIYTPWFNIVDGGPEENEAEVDMDQCMQYGATF